MEGQVVGRHPEGSGGSPLLSPLLSKPPLLLPCAGLHAPAAVAALIAEQSSSATGLSPSPPSCSPSYLILIFMQQQPALAG